MFERNPIDAHAATVIAVVVTLDDGRTIHGRAALDRGHSVHRLLAGDDAFLYVEQSDGAGQFVPKAQIRGVSIVRPIVPRPLRQPEALLGAFDPRRVLGVGVDAPWPEIKRAYRTLAKRYHPDRFESVDLPAEVAAYLDAKSRQINQAFDILKAEHAETAPAT